MRPPVRPQLLVVDDEASIREALTAALEGSYTVHTATSGAEAHAILRARPIAVIILDAILREEHGLDLVPAFRARSAAPILMLTGHSCEDLLVRSIWARVDGFLKKPVNLTELREAVRRLTPLTDPTADLAARARRHLDEHYAKPYAPAELAGQLGICEAYLRRLFRTAYGKTPRRYLIERRMSRAAALLQTTARTVDQIATDVGYPSSTLFGRAFQAAYHLTPSAYRAMGGARPPRRPPASAPEGPEFQNR